MFQIAIVAAGIAVLLQRRWFWYVCLVLSVVGLVFFVQGLLLALGS